MRRIAKLSLLLAPLVLASISGCATPSWMSRSEPTDPREARVNRLLAVAAEYETEGKQDAAMRVYEHVLAQQPEHPMAIERRDLLAQQGVKSGGRSLKHELPSSAPQASKEMFASTTKPKAAPAKDDVKDIASEIHRKNAELAQMLAQQKTSKQPVVALPSDKAAFDNDLKPTPIAEETLVARSETNLEKLLKEASTVEDPGWAATGSSGGWSVVSEDTASSKPSHDEFKPARTMSIETAETAAVEKTEKAALPADDENGWAVAENSKPAVELASLTPSKEKVATAQDDSAWQTTDLTRSAPKETASTETEDKWETTRLAGLCDNLSPELVPLVAKLESRNSAERVAGLLELGEMKTSARSASVAVYSLMEDKDAVVAVYAAGTLRQVTGDAWSSVHTLTKYLQHDDPGIAQLSAYLLGQMGPEAMDAVPSLEKVRNGNRGLTSLHAAEALTHIAPADSSSVQKLTAALSESDRELRWFAAVSLGTVAGECEQQAAEALKKALQDHETDVRVAACLSLGGLGNHAAIAIPELEQAARSDSPDVKSAAETALACLRG